MGFISKKACVPNLTSIVSGVLTKGYETKGNAVTDTIFDDSNPDQIESIPPDAFHRNVDLAIVQADKEGAFLVLISLLAAVAHFRNRVQVMSAPISSFPPRFTVSNQTRWWMLAS